MKLPRPRTLELEAMVAAKELEMLLEVQVCEAFRAHDAADLA